MVICMPTSSRNERLIHVARAIGDCSLRAHVMNGRIVWTLEVPALVLVARSRRACGSDLGGALGVILARSRRRASHFKRPICCPVVNTFRLERLRCASYTHTVIIKIYQ